ncbi:MAG TPA: hypothetical protein V6D47_12370 [Oscillatoriaceae cyanobacterium]
MAVGGYGVYERAVFRELSIGGLLPVNVYYALLLLVGAGILLIGSPSSPFHASRLATLGQAGPLRQAWFVLRAAVCIALFGALTWLSLFH